MSGATKTAWRRFGGTAAVLGEVVVIVAVALAALSTGLVRAGAEFGGDAQRATPARSPMGIPFDPLVRPATIGYLPAAMSERHLSIGTDYYTVVYEWDMKSIHDDVPVATRVTLDMWREGAAPWQVPPGEAVGAAVEPVNGRPAFWGQSALRWEFRPGAWVQVRLEQTVVNADVYPAVPLPDPGLAVTEQVARSVQFAAGRRLRFPWHLRGLPVGLVPLSAQLAHEPGSRWTVEFVLATTARPGAVAVILTSAASPESRSDSSDPAGNAILVVTRHGVRHQLAFVAPATPPSQGLRSLFDGFEFFDDPAGWTDHPLDG